MRTEHPVLAAVISRRRFLLGGLAGGALAAGAIAISPLGAKINNHLPCQVQALEASLPPGSPASPASWWHLSDRNPVLDVLPQSSWESLAVFDPSVIRVDDGSLKMWYSTRGQWPSGIGLALDSSGSGDTWARVSAQPVLQSNPSERPPYTDITRPSVLRTSSGYRMWYSTVGQDQGSGVAWIGTATSADGIHWQKHGAPVLAPSELWEKTALQCPNVRFNAASGLHQMWYSGGDQYEPDAVGFATSPDGIQWTRAKQNPIFKPSTGWEDYKVGSFQVTYVENWYYAFYNAFQQQPFVCRIGMARSRDGISNWERHPTNPILVPGGPCAWDAAMVYKPTALWDDQRKRWDVWFNASMTLNQQERIGHAWSDRIW